ncbi:MAG: hypothetical protein JSS91_09935 [Bacteroidetes bacterium]|nr:hypothetical protein [Bacteroidota bacterium]
MKKIYYSYIVLSLFIALIFSSCSSNSTTGGGIINPGGGGTGNVTFTTSVATDPNTNQPYFQFVPSTGVTLTKITVTCAQLQISNEVVNGDGTTVWTQQNPLYLGPVQGLAAGQQWTFVIEGKVGSATGTAYTTTVNYTTQ